MRQNRVSRETLWSFTAPSKGTHWEQYHSTLLVTVFRDEYSARIVQVLPVSKSSIVMLERSGAWHYREIPHGMIQAIEEFSDAKLKDVMDRVFTDAEEMLLPVTKTIQ